MRVIFFLFIGSFAFAIFNAAGAQTTLPPELTKIGVVVSLTGPASEQGKNWLDGARLAIEEHQARGEKVELIVEDDATTGVKAASAFTKLATIDKVYAIIGGTWDYLAQASYPLAKRFRVPFLTLTNPVEVVAEGAKDNQFVFTSGMSIAAAREASTRWFKISGARRAAVLYSAVPFGALYADMFRGVVKASNGTITLDYEYALEDYRENVRVQAAKLGANLPDVIFIETDAGALDGFLSELARQKISVPVLTTQHLDAAFAMTGNAQKFRHAYGVYPKLTDPSFSERFRARYGRALRVYNAEGYDAANFLLAARRAQVNFSESPSFRFVGITGIFALPCVNHELVHVDAEIMTTRSGAFGPWSGETVD